MESKRVFFVAYVSFLQGFYEFLAKRFERRNLWMGIGLKSRMAHATKPRGVSQIASHSQLPSSSSEGTLVVGAFVSEI